MQYEFILQQIMDKVYILTINRPEIKNKLNVPCMKELIQALKSAEEDRECSAIVLTGSGNYFCNGGELGDYRINSSVEILEYGNAFIKLHTTIIGLSKPVIAAVQGFAHGGGFSLVEACDFAVASEKVTFGVPEMHSGLAPMMALTGLAQVLSRKKVMELSLFGDPISAQNAVNIGLINEICKPEGVLPRAVEIAKHLSLNNPTAMSLCKKLYQSMDGLNYEKQMECGLNILISLLKSEDAKEALTAEEQKRTPVWKGR